MSTTKPYAQQFQPQDGGMRLGDWEYLRTSILNMNTSSATYGIVALGTTQATAQPLNSVLNQVDTVTSSTGVNLPFSSGKHNVPYQWIIIVNNGANSLSVYGAQGSTDTINGTAGSTAQTVPAGATALFNSIKPGAWFSGDINDAGTFTSITNSGNFTETGVGFGFVQKLGTNGRAGTFTLNGATTVTVTNTSTQINDFIGISLNTVGGTVGVYPHITTVLAGTGFTVIGTASDTSVYNYSMFGTN